MNKIKILLFVIICLIGLYLRLYHIEFGLPHSFYADEPEIAEPAIKYTYELKNIITENNWYKLIPISYVYGTFSVYLFTEFTIIFSKTLNLLNIGFDKTAIFIYLRVVSNLLTLTLPVLIYLITDKIFNKKIISITALLLALFNWKLIVHAHYLNNDILQTTLITCSLYFAYLYFKNPTVKKFTILGGIAFGLAIGTKITTLITLPLIIFLYISKKDIKGFLIYIFLILGAFIITNPFSLIFWSDFVNRVFIMAAKEGGIVFDSVDLSPFKYIFSLMKISHIIVFILSIFAFIKIFIKKDFEKFHLLMLGQVLIYLIFFSIQSRRVDRWMLPVLPIILIYASYGIFLIQDYFKKPVFYFGLLFFCLSYLSYPYLLTKQFSRYTPKSNAYLWMQQNSNIMQKKLVYTEEGLDPMNKLPNAQVKKIEVYPNQNAHLYYPVDAKYFDFIIISSRPMEYYKKDIVRKKYPLYYQRWSEFEKSLQNKSQYEKVQEFLLPKPNLIPLSDVYIYKNLNVEKYPKDNL